MRTSPLVFALAALLAALPAAAVPLELTHTGRLVDSLGAPLDGEHTLDVSLHTSPAGGDVAWSKTGMATTFSDGFFAVRLGNDGTLDASALDVGPLWLEIAVDGGTPMSPRLPLSSVPYAVLAHSLSGGTVDATAIRINGNALLGEDGSLALPLDWSTLTGVPADLTDGDADSFAALSCADGQVLKWSSGAFVCGDDADTNTQLTEADVDSFVANNGYAMSDDLAAVATSGAYADLTGAPAALPPSGTAGGDLAGAYPNPTIGANKVTNAHLAADAASLAKLTGGALAVSGTGADRTVTLDARLSGTTEVGPHGYVKFFTDRVKNTSTTDNQQYVLLDMRCSGHWGSYYAEIELVTYYYRPAVRRYEFFCGNGNHTSGGTLREISATQVTSPLVSLALANTRATVHQHSGIQMYESQLVVTQPAYAESYARVTSYGSWPSHRKGTAFSDTSPSAVWQTWTK